MTKPQRRELKKWMTSAFEKYARGHAESNLSAIPRETPQQHQARIQAYGQQFGRVILGDLEMNDTPKMLNDLQHLLKAKCPALDLVELMLVCTNGFGMISTFLRTARRFTRSGGTTGIPRTTSCNAPSATNGAGKM